jgi:hypothetical protein
VKRSQAKFHSNNWKMSAAHRVRRSTNVLDALPRNHSLRPAMRRGCDTKARDPQSVANKKPMPQNKTAGLAPGGLQKNPGSV